jgi:hypothetical protein
MTATQADAVELEEGAAQRQARLAGAVRALGTRAGGPERARVLLVLGGVLVPLGIALILLGWSGAAHTTDLFEQIPYIISGGLLGLAVLISGGVCYLAFWLTQLVYATRRDAADTRAALQRIEQALLDR